MAEKSTEATNSSAGVTKRRFEVRTNCEYVLHIEADSAEEALAQAENTDMVEWDKAWAEMEAEPAGDGQE